jgi:hypothetical protein
MDIVTHSVHKVTQYSETENVVLISVLILVPSHLIVIQHPRSELKLLRGVIFYFHVTQKTNNFRLQTALL